jgi:hypothetical protein
VQLQSQTFPDADGGLQAKMQPDILEDSLSAKGSVYQQTFQTL